MMNSCTPNTTHRRGKAIELTKKRPRRRPTKRPELPAAPELTPAEALARVADVRQWLAGEFAALGDHIAACDRQKQVAAWHIYRRQTLRDVLAKLDGTEPTTTEKP